MTTPVKALFVFNLVSFRISDMPTLASLLREFPLEVPNIPDKDISISGIVSDSRKAEAGSLFVAVKGESSDGHKYITSAIEHGASAVVGENLIADHLKVPYMRVPNSRQALAFLAAAFYDNPARKMAMIGVTGTDGKTTTCNLLYQILKSAGLKAGMVSTVNAKVGDEIIDTGFHVTTPDALDTQRYLAMMVEKGLTHVILETTSHGWAQYRVDACDFDLGVITNITHEHLDYHGSFGEYRLAKSRLFTSLHQTRQKKHKKISLAVLNRDDGSYDYLSSVTKVSQLSYGVDQSADYRAEDIHFSPHGLSFKVIHEDEAYEIVSPLVGAFNLSNCLSAYTAAVAGLSISPQTAIKGIADLAGVPGRMERIDLGQNFTAIVDFAHTPNALLSALKTARQITSGRVITVFGCAGLRDREKRRMMAEVSTEFADISIFTAEDPRTESLDSILNEMAAGAKSKGGSENRTFWLVRDRGDAIRKAVQLAKKNDLVIACGKGHEQSMCFGEIEYPWDDRTAMRSVLSDELGLVPVEMPFLPTQNE